MSDGDRERGCKPMTYDQKTQMAEAYHEHTLETRRRIKWWFWSRVVAMLVGVTLGIALSRVFVWVCHNL